MSAPRLSGILDPAVPGHLPAVESPQDGEAAQALFGGQKEGHFEFPGWGEVDADVDPEGLGGQAWATRAASTIPQVRGVLPVVAIPEQYHVGDLQGGGSKRSHEGGGVSVSACPESWREIARLGDAPVWLLRRPEGSLGLFLDVHAAQGSPVGDCLDEAAIAAGLLRRSRLYQVTTTDEEGDEWVSQYRSRREARDNLDEDISPKDIEVIDGLVPTKALVKAIGWESPLLNARVHAWRVLIDRYQPDLDGLWWGDVFDPDGLSAPRAVILPSRLDRWVRGVV